MTKKRRRQTPNIDFSYTLDPSWNVLPAPPKGPPESLLRPKEYGPETEEDYYLRLVSELQGFDLGMAGDPIWDVDIVERMERMDQPKRDAASLARELANTNDKAVRSAVDQVLAANRALRTAVCVNGSRGQKSPRFVSNR